MIDMDTTDPIFQLVWIFAFTSGLTYLLTSIFFNKLRRQKDAKEETE